MSRKALSWIASRTTAPEYWLSCLALKAPELPWTGFVLATGAAKKTHHWGLAGLDWNVPAVDFSGPRHAHLTSSHHLGLELASLNTLSIAGTIVLACNSASALSNNASALEPVKV